MITINNIFDLLHILFDVLGSDFTAEVTSGECLDDTIKVIREGSTNAMYISFDENFPSVIEAAVYDEPEGYHESDEFPIAEGICWDTEDEKLTPEVIAADIEKEF